MNKITNFEFLRHHDELLVRLAETAEMCFVPDPNTTLVKMRQLGEELAKTIASRVGVEADRRLTQRDLLFALDSKLRLDRQVKNAFRMLRELGNPAAHDITSSTHRDALKSLQVGHVLSGWFHVQFGGLEAEGFKLPAFIKPQDPSARVREVEEKLLDLQKQVQTAQNRLELAESVKAIDTEKAEAEQLRAQAMAEESKIWEQIATEQEAKLEEYRTKMDAANVTYYQTFGNLEAPEQAKQIQRIEKSTLELNEAETRIIIDQQLIEAGWEADTENLRYSKGARPIAGKNRAIAEWPTSSGPADYVLFMGLTPVATVEAKKHNKRVSSDIEQAKRYARDLQADGSIVIETQYGEQGEYKVPLTFATNGRPYLKQLEQESGIWFLDVRDNTNRRRALQGWFKPEEIKTYLRQTTKKAEAQLDQMDFNYSFDLRDYQIDAIRAVEKAIKAGEQRALVAMATGTGKTKTAITLIFRLLKTERFRRILFLVDRSALGVQASNDFEQVKFIRDEKFADAFEVMGMEPNKSPKAKPENSTKVHVTTVQGLVKRLLYPSDNDARPGVGQYDCIVVDECHRGYLLDKELGETELMFRNQADYQSKYRSVIDYFDAFKIGLTATPALHTSEIFGEPIFTYSYTEAVLDGFLNDHLPPVRINTRLSKEGINYSVNEEVKVYNLEDNTIESYNTPDELQFDVADFNKKIVAPENTNVITKWLIESDSINPYLEAKTLIFCVTDKHADDVVEALKDAIENYHGEVEDNAVMKITGSIDKPIDHITHYKNDRLPNIAVTVDLLTTGIDVPEICNLVFLRRVNSRILFEQMLGRATRLCPEIGKGPFRIFDAVDIYKTLEKVNTMKPVVTKVDVSFSELEEELINSDAPELIALAKNQFIVKLQTKKRHLNEEQQDAFEVIAGQSPDQFAKTLKNMSLADAADWFKQHPGLGAMLDRKITKTGGANPTYFHGGNDEFTHTTTGYGQGQKPEDYLNAFDAFINANSNRMIAIQTVVQKPWELTRQSLKELAVTLEQNHFREKDLQQAWQEVKQEDIAAKIIGFIRQAALGEALVPWDERVDKALDKILARQVWKTPQKQWLELIAKQMKATTIVDETALDQGIFKHQGGIKRANKLFEEPITEILQQFNQALWVS